MHVRDIMNRMPVALPSDCPVQLAALRMKGLGVGILAIVDDGRIVGVVTDRDITVLAASANPASNGMLVRDVMSRNPVCCLPDHSVKEAAALMGDHQVRRLPVLNRKSHLVGILSVDDIARDVSERLAGETLGEIVEAR